MTPTDPALAVNRARRGERKSLVGRLRHVAGRLCSLIGVSLLFCGVPAFGQTAIVTNPYLGVERLAVSVTAANSATGRAYSYNAFRINLSAPGLSFRTSPNNGSAANEVTTQRTSDFVQQQNAQIGINANFFDYNGFADFFGPYTSGLLTVAVSNGVGVSPFDTNHPNALNISASNVATFVTGGVVGGYGNAQNLTLYNTIGFNGSGLLYSSGTVSSFLKGLATSGTYGTLDRFPGVGLYTAPDSTQRLILLASDSINSWEMIKAFEYLSAGGSGLSAMTLDGGGSTSLYFRDPFNNNSLTALNASNRYVGNSLAVFAAPVPEPATWIGIAAGGIVLLIRRHCRAGRTNSQGRAHEPTG